MTSRKIGTQVLLLSAVPLAFLLLLLALAFIVENRNGTIVAGSERSAQILAGSDHASTVLNNAARAVITYDRTRKISTLAPYRASSAQLAVTLSGLQRLVSDNPGQTQNFERMEVAYNEGVSVLRDYLRYVQAHQGSAAKRLADSPRVRRVNADITSSVARFNNAERAQTTLRLREIRTQVQTYSVLLVVLCVFGIGLTMLIAGRFGLDITQRVKRLAENARRLAQGKTPLPISGDDEIAQLDQVYQEMAQRIAHERDRSSALQSALLPQQLPSLPGVRLDAAYAPAASTMEIGGDWYDVFYISDHTVGISIGDVAGHGLRAAATMGTARQAIRTVAYIDDDPARVLTHVNAVLCRNEGGLLVTAFFAAFDLLDGSLRYAVAGHPPPLLVRTGGAVGALAGKGFVLGVDSLAKFDGFSDRLEIGSALVLYTDGVVEAGRDYFAGLRKLKEAVEDEYRNAEHNIAKAIVRRVFDGCSPHDDSALLFMGVTALGEDALQPECVSWDVDARSERSARRVKRALLWRLGDLTRDDAQLAACELIVSELLGNVARHTPGPATVYLESTAGTVRLRVRDHGERFWLPGRHEPGDPFSENGRGLFLVHAVAADVAVEWTGNGNSVCAVLPIQVQRAVDIPVRATT